jgi:secreted PhoX family phosphatase
MLNRSQLAEQAEDKGSNTTTNDTMGDLIAARFSRRELMRGALAVSAISATLSPFALATASGVQAQTALPKPAFDFKEITAGPGVNHDVAEGYDADVLMRPGVARRAGVRSDGADRRRAAHAVRLQQRLRRLPADAWVGPLVARPARRQS